MRRLFVIPPTALLLAALAYLQPTSEAAYRANNIGVALLEQFNFERAASSFRDALKLAPALAIARLNLAIALFYGGDAAAAAAEAQAAAAALPDSPQVLYVRGLIARAQEQPEDAIRLFQRVAEIDPRDAGSRVNLGQLFTQQRRFPEAIAAFRAALAAEPYNATAAYGIATAHIRAGQADEGREAMQRFQTLRDTTFATTYSQTYLEQGRYAEAIASTGAEPELIDAQVPAVRFADATSAAFRSVPKAGGQAEAPAIGRPLGADLGPEARQSLARGIAGGVTAFDADGDSDLDLVAVDPSGIRLFENNGAGAFVDVTARSRLSATGGVPIGAVAGDYDNDTRADILVLGYGRHWLWHRRADGTFEDASAAVPAYCCLARSAAFVDVDHDGDLDIFIAGLADPGQPMSKPGGTFPADAAPAPQQLIRNNGNGTFSDITAVSGIAGAAHAIAIVPTDFDNHRDVDLLVAAHGGAQVLFKNLRDGTFRDVAADVGLAFSAAYTTVAAADVNKDGYTDFYFGRGQEPGTLAMSDGRERFATDEAPAGSQPSRAAQFVDYDNDGLLDLLTASDSSIRLFRNLGNRWVDVSREAGLEDLGKGLTAPVQSIAIADVDANGYADVLVRLGDGDLRCWRSSGGRNRSLVAALTSRVSNRSAIGAKIEMRAGSLRQKLERSSTTPAIAPADSIFGLATRAAADVVRVIWPSGILQSETQPGEAGPRATGRIVAALTELDRKPSSCPFLYTWNGTRFEFVTDFMGGGEMGAWLAPSTWNDPDPDEYVRIRPDQLRPRNGRYELRVTNELEEVLFVDRLQLLAIDHPPDVEVHPNEGLKSAPRPPFTLIAARAARAPRAARDEHGHDVSAALAALDRKYVDDYRLAGIQGYADPHELRLDLGPDVSNPVILMTGWTDYAFSTDNLAASQSQLGMTLPSVQARKAAGAWRTVIEDMGFPVGRPQTVAVDLRGRLEPGEREVRVLTSMRIYWDQVRIASAGDNSMLRLSRMDPVVAELRWRGYSAETTPDGRPPIGYDYHDVSTMMRWKTPAGRYTREGDVRGLLLQRDDMFVISQPGDEVVLSFDAAAVPATPAGWTRTFLLYAHGYSKEMNIRSARPDTVEPLPFTGMTGYPYPASERYPRGVAHEEYQSRYNTRVVTRVVPSVEAGLILERPARHHPR